MYIEIYQKIRLLSSAMIGGFRHKATDENLIM